MNYVHTDINAVIKAMHATAPHPVSSLIWVKETFAMQSDGTVLYRSGEGPKLAKGFPWRPSIFMPRAASRITLEVTAVRVEKVQDISDTDLDAEGCATGRCYICWPEEWPEIESPSHHYTHLWESINGKGSWSLNPFVWVYEFKRVKP